MQTLNTETLFQAVENTSIRQYITPPTKRKKKLSKYKRLKMNRKRK